MDERGLILQLINWAGFMDGEGELTVGPTGVPHQSQGSLKHGKI